MDRSQLKVDVFYLLPSGKIFITPDGRGGYWYDSLDEAREQHGDYPIYGRGSIPEN